MDDLVVADVDCAVAELQLVRNELAVCIVSVAAKDDVPGLEGGHDIESILAGDLVVIWVIDDEQWELEHFDVPKRSQELRPCFMQPLFHMKAIYIDLMTHCVVLNYTSKSLLGFLSCSLFLSF